MNDIDENLRELCAVGDLELVRNYVEKQKPDLNSQNKVNGWTALHWACKRNHVDVVRYLIQNGASNEICNKDAKKPCYYATHSDINQILSGGETAAVVVDPVVDCDEKFVPAYLKYPDFSHLRHFKDEKSKTGPTESKAPTATIQTSSSSIITIKIRLHTDTDFIEIDLDKENTSFEQFKVICAHELQLQENGGGQRIEKIRKLPNVLMRDDRDMKRLKNDQEIVIICI